MEESDMKVNFEHKGNFNKLEKFLVKSLHITPLVKPILEKYGKLGVEALKEATPKDTGKTADSWTYKVVKDEDNKYEIVWSNTNVVDGWANIAILLQYGHATRNGGFVKGTDYINPAIEKVFQGMANEAWEEVKQHGYNG
jgi:hypothetical protein